VTIEVKNLMKEYTLFDRKKEVLNDINLTIKLGELICVTGHSGSGKTTLINIIAGLTRPTSGSVFFCDKDIFTLSDDELSLYRNVNIGYLPQGYSMLSSFSILDNVRLPSYLSKLRENSIDDAFRLLELFQVDKFANSLPKQLSGGEIKRAAIARAMINKPNFLLVDEPTGDLDTQTAQLIMEIFRNLVDNGVSILMITHEPDTLVYADKAYTIDNGFIHKVTV